VNTAIRAGVERINYVGPTASDWYDVSLFGPSGIMRTLGHGPVPKWVPSKRRLEWPSGQVCCFYSGEEPEQLRGPQSSLVLIDEIGRMAKQAEIFHQTGSTYENAEDLSPVFLEQMKFYEDTRIGRQELYGQLLLDPENALFIDNWIIRGPVPEEMIDAGK
jgi:phage terminase large subunit-like protein